MTVTVKIIFNTKSIVANFIQNKIRDLYFLFRCQAIKLQHFVRAHSYSTTRRQAKMRKREKQQNRNTLNEFSEKKEKYLKVEVIDVR